MHKMFLWILSGSIGVGMWYTAAAGDAMTGWAKFGMMLLFWTLLAIYTTVEKVADAKR